MTSKLRTARRCQRYFVGDANRIRSRDPGHKKSGWPHNSIQIFALQPHLHIELEVIFLAIRTYGMVDFKLLIVLVHFKFAGGASFSLDRSGERCAFVRGNLAIGERRQRRHGEYRHRRTQSHELGSPVGVW